MRSDDVRDGRIGRRSEGSAYQSKPVSLYDWNALVDRDARAAAKSRDDVTWKVIDGSGIDSLDGNYFPWEWTANPKAEQQRQRRVQERRTSERRRFRLWEQERSPARPTKQLSWWDPQAKLGGVSGIACADSYELGGFSDRPSLLRERRASSRKKRSCWERWCCF